MRFSLDKLAGDVIKFFAQLRGGLLNSALFNRARCSSWAHINNIIKIFMSAYIKKEIKFFILIINNVIKIFMVAAIIYLIKIFMW